MSRESSSTAATARVVSMNVGGIREVEWRGRVVTTGIWKQPVSGPVALVSVNFAGDDEADRTEHGGRENAVYAYSVEDYAYWRRAHSNNAGFVW